MRILREQVAHERIVYMETNLDMSEVAQGWPTTACLARVGAFEMILETGGALGLCAVALRAQKVRYEACGTPGRSRLAFWRLRRQVSQAGKQDGL